MLIGFRHLLSAVIDEPSKENIRSFHWGYPAAVLATNADHSIIAVSPVREWRIIMSCLGCIVGAINIGRKVIAHKEIYACKSRGEIIVDNTDARECDLVVRGFAININPGIVRIRETHQSRASSQRDSRRKREFLDAIMQYRIYHFRHLYMFARSHASQHGSYRSDALQG
jgi:hypothetical protein